MEDYEIEVIQKMFKSQREISLTFEQAKEIYKYEKLRNTPSSHHNYFSIWEELDFEFVSFQKILNEEQFTLYKKDREASIKFQEEQLGIQDKNNVSQLKVAQDLLDYYETIFLPVIAKKQPFFGGLFVNEWSKIVYLRGEYKKYLDDTKKSILVNHFRHYKTFSPISLELSLLRHQHDCLLPNYQPFLLASDLPTKTVANFLQDKLKRIDQTRFDEVEELFDELKRFNRANFLKHVGELQGWHVNIAEEPFNLMPVLLMDSKMYVS